MNNQKTNEKKIYICSIAVLAIIILILGFFAFKSNKPQLQEQATNVHENILLDEVTHEIRLFEHNEISIKDRNEDNNENITLDAVNSEILNDINNLKK